jgi:hypothetical protein
MSLSGISDTVTHAHKKSGAQDVIGCIAASKTIFYQRAAEKTGNPMGKRMFLSMKEDEKKLHEIFWRRRIGWKKQRT